LRTLLRDFTLEPTSEHGERWHSRGVAYCPAKGGRAVVHRRTREQQFAGHVRGAAVRSTDDQES